jgi:hypothetical protein
MILDFLKKEYRKDVDEMSLHFKDAIKRYHEHFKDDGLITQTSHLNKCLCILKIQ